MTQSEAEAVSGGVVRMEQSGAGEVKAQSVQMVNSGAQSVETLKADISSSGMLVLKSREVIMDQCGVGILQGGTINAHRVSAVVVTGPVHGNIQAMLTPPAAFALGLGAVSAVILAGVLGRSLLGRSRSTH